MAPRNGIRNASILSPASPRRCNSFCVSTRAVGVRALKAEIMSDPQTDRTDVYVSAFFCDRLLREHDGILSAIRVVDLFVIPVPEQGATSFIPRLETNLVIIFRSKSQADFTATISATDPRGIVQSSSGLVSLTGEPDIYVYTMAIDIFITDVLEGTHWYDIFVNGSLANRIPLHVKHVKVPTSRELRQTWKSPDEGSRS